MARVSLSAVSQPQDYLKATPIRSNDSPVKLPLDVPRHSRTAIFANGMRCVTSSRPICILVNHHPTNGSLPEDWGRLFIPTLTDGDKDDFILRDFLDRHRIRHWRISVSLHWASKRWNASSARNHCDNSTNVSSASWPWKANLSIRGSNQVVSSTVLLRSRR